MLVLSSKKNADTKIHKFPISWQEQRSVFDWQADYCKH